MIERIPELVNGDPAVQRWGRHMNDIFMVVVGAVVGAGIEAANIAAICLASTRPIMWGNGATALPASGFCASSRRGQGRECCRGRDCSRTITR